MPLGPGDLLFVGWDADNDDIAFIATTEIPAGEVIYFTDNEWDGGAFIDANEHMVGWTVPSAGLQAGQIVEIDMNPAANTLSFSIGGTVDVVSNGFDVAGQNEMYWAFQGTRTADGVTPTNFVSVIANEAGGSDRQTPNLSGTGLTPENGAIIIDGDEDFMQWNASGSLPEPVDRQALINSVLDTENWTTADGVGNSNPNPGAVGFVFAPVDVVCFVAGTAIRTEMGSRPVEDLKEGDLVQTLDGGSKPIRWIGRRQLFKSDLRVNPRLRPVRIMAGALGDGLPVRDLLVSRQHRVLLNSRVARRMFGRAEVLVPAFRLTDLPGIYVDESQTDVTYFHLLFDRHEVIFAEGAPTESLFAGPQALKMVPQAARDEILAIFPELSDHETAAEPARVIPPPARQKTLVARHAKSGRPLREVTTTRAAALTRI